MVTQLERRCVEGRHLGSVSDLLRKMVEFSEDRGFGRTSATVFTQRSPTLGGHQRITNALSGHIPDFEDLDAARFDPVVQHVTVHPTPIVWDQSTYVSCGQAYLWDRQTPYGYSSGNEVGHPPAARPTLPIRPRLRSHNLHHTAPSGAAARGHPAVRRTRTRRRVRTLRASRPSCTRATESDRRRTRGAALVVGRHGMTRWEVGRKLGLSERDVALRLQRVIRKLGCGSTYRAGLVAIRLEGDNRMLMSEIRRDGWASNPQSSLSKTGGTKYAH
jgi:hypothetical protein